MIIAAAKRLSDVSEYYFSRKLEQIRLMNEAGRNVINLGIGSPDLAPSPETITAAKAALDSPKNHGYAAYRGTPELRHAIADWYSRIYGVNASADKNVLPLLGSKEGLFYIAMAFLNDGDGVLVPNPGYPAYSSVSRLAGAKICAYELNAKNNWWPDFDALEKTDLKGIKLMWVNYPHMPTGASGSAELFTRLVEFGRRHGILICHDNPYGMVLNETPPLSLLKFDPKMEVSLELNSFSKAFNMAGWRVGMMLANQDVLDTVLKVKSNVDSGMFLPIQSGAIEALKNASTWHDERNRIYRERREWTHKIFDQLGFQYSKNQVGLFTWAKAPSEVSNVEAHLDLLLEKAAVFITPGFIFGSAGSSYARCSLCAPIEKLKEAGQRLAGAL
jgi:LL-diaminopimelate aminotransferase